MPAKECIVTPPILYAALPGVIYTYVRLRGEEQYTHRLMRSPL
jgi:hypothetical protein